MQDMLDRQRRDDVELLGVEQDQEPGNPVGGRVRVVVEEPARVCPPAVLVAGDSGGSARGPAVAMCEASLTRGV